MSVKPKMYPCYNKQCTRLSYSLGNYCGGCQAKEDNKSKSSPPRTFSKGIGPQFRKHSIK